MNAAEHPVFESAPLREGPVLSTGPAPVPYHVYKGHGLVILGTCPIDAVTAKFAGQDVHPVRTTTGNAILVVFVCDFAQASHGPHLELHVTALASPQPDQVIPDDPAAALAALANQPDWGVLSVHLWNDTPQVVAYNTEYLGLSARQSQGHVTVRSDHVDFAFQDTSGVPLLSGQVRLNRRSDAGMMFRVLRHLGLPALWHAVRRQPATAHVINRKCEVLPHNGFARTTTAPDKMIVTAFDPSFDSFDATGGPLEAIAFKPLIMEHLSPFRFIYRHPDDV